MMFPKTKRHEDRELLDSIARQPCVVCGENKRSGQDPDHVTSRGAGGGDTIDNVMPLCRRHHTERHAIGVAQMARKYPKYLAWLRAHERTDVLDRMARTHDAKAMD